MRRKSCRIVCGKEGCGWPVATWTIGAIWRRISAILAVRWGLWFWGDMVFGGEMKGLWICWVWFEGK